MNEANKLKLGVFVTVSISLIVLAFLFAGIAKYFEPKLEILTIFKNSVEGLKVGSPVKYKGVTLGRITRIAMRNTDEYINVYMVVFSSAMDAVSGDSGKIVKSSSSLSHYVKALKDKKVRCSLQSAGITGGAYVELDSSVEDGDEIVLKDIKLPEDVIYIPARYSHISAVIENLSKTVENISRIDFAELVTGIRQTLKNIENRIGGEKIDDLINNLNKVGELADSMKGAITKEDLQKVYGDINKVCSSVDSLAGEMKEAFNKEETRKLYKELGDCLRSLDTLAKSTNMTQQRMSKEFGDIKTRLIVSLAKLNDTLENVSDLTKTIEEQPSSILRGKGKPETVVVPGQE